MQSFRPTIFVYFILLVQTSCTPIEQVVIESVTIPENRNVIYEDTTTPLTLTSEEVTTDTTSVELSEQLKLNQDKDNNTLSKFAAISYLNTTKGFSYLRVKNGTFGVGKAGCKCGKFPLKIPTGEESSINSQPWTVAIVRGELTTDERPHCAGVLINDRYVLTSASCVDGLRRSSFQVWFTVLNSLKDHDLSVGTSKINVHDVIMHPKYNRNSKENDICIIKLSHPVDISSSFISPICVPSDLSNDYAGRTGGTFSWNNGRSSQICTKDVPIMDNSACNKDSRHNGYILGNMMCVGYVTPTARIVTDEYCVGDHGGPLTVTTNGKASLVGLASWGFEYHHRGNSPIVYTRISRYSDWIGDNTLDADWCES